jgi:hypothetical protein
MRRIRNRVVPILLGMRWDRHSRISSHGSNARIIARAATAAACCSARQGETEQTRSVCSVAKHSTTSATLPAYPPTIRTDIRKYQIFISAVAQYISNESTGKERTMRQVRQDEFDRRTSIGTGRKLYARFGEPIKRHLRFVLLGTGSILLLARVTAWALPAGPYANWSSQQRAQAANEIKQACNVSCSPYASEALSGDLRASYEAAACQEACFYNRLPVDYPGLAQIKQLAIQNMQQAKSLGSNARIFVNSK